MPLFETRDLALYASIVGTLNGGWALYNGAFRDRPRVVVRAAKGEAHGGIGEPAEIFMVTVANRGRRPVSINSISRYQKLIRGISIVTTDLMQQTADHPRLDESHSRTFVHGQMGGYTHGDLAETRWYVVDGAGRVWPLRERYRQRLLAFLFWPIRRILNRRDRRARSGNGSQPPEVAEL